MNEPSIRWSTMPREANPRMANWKPKNIITSEASPRDKKREEDFVASHLTANKLGIVAMPKTVIFNAPCSALADVTAVRSAVRTKPQGRSPHRRPSRYEVGSEADLNVRMALPQRLINPENKSSGEGVNPINADAI